MEFKLRGAFIELDNMLKVRDLVPKGSDAKKHIHAGEVLVNGEVETRVRRKLYDGDVVEFSGKRVMITA